MMTFLRALWFRLHALITDRRVSREIDREMAFHVEMETANNIRAGFAPDEARRRANVSFGGRQRFREETRDEIRSRGLEDLIQDVRHAGRTFRRTPGFTATVVLTLALGIGATTVIFSVADNVVLRSLPYRNADRLVGIQVLSDRLKNVTPTWVPNAAHYLAWKNACTVCEGIAAVRPGQLTLSGVGDPAVISVYRVSDNLFSMLGAHAEMGRLLTPGDDTPGNEHLVVISDDLWRQQFGARADIVGRAVTIGDAQWTVLGVVAPDFRMFRGGELGPFLRLPSRGDAYVPLALNAREKTTPGEHDYGVIAMLKPDATPAALRAQLDAISAANAVALRDDPPSRTSITPLQAQVVGSAGRPLLLLLAAVAAMLLIMCVNLATLFLARSAARRRESAVRVALGAGRGRLMRQALAETVTLSLIGGLAGVVLSRWGVRALVALAPADLPRIDEVHIDGRVLAVGLLVSVLAGLSFGFVPALRFGRTAPGDVLKESSRGATESRSGARARSWLIGSQVGLSAVLLVVAGLFLKSFVRVLHADRGFSAQRVLALDVTLPSSAYPTRAQRNQYYGEVMQRASALPGVSAVALTSALPLEGEGWIDGLAPESDANGGWGKEVDANFRFVSPNFFDVLGIALKKGRTFVESDRGQHVVILSENAARALWPNEDPIGKYVHAGNDSLSTVVGVAADVRTTGIEHDASLTVYHPYWYRGYAPTVLVRTTGDPAALTNSVRGALRQFAPSVPISHIRTIDQVVSTVVAQRRFELVLIGLFAITALLTASIGIYGIISHSLNRRANELGIRIALGARPVNVHALVLREVLTPVVLGLIGGVIASRVMSGLIAGLLYEVRPTDAATFAAVAFLLAIVATVACWIPTRRATQIDPVEALRAG
jgi:predicted permease